MTFLREQQKWSSKIRVVNLTDYINICIYIKLKKIFMFNVTPLKMINI